MDPWAPPDFYSELSKFGSVVKRSGRHRVELVLIGLISGRVRNCWNSRVSLSQEVAGMLFSGEAGRFILWSKSCGKNVKVEAPDHA